MNDFVNPFILPVDQYKRDINIMNHYVEDVAKHLSIQTKKPIEQCKEFVLKNLKPNGLFPFKDREIKYLERMENGDREEKSSGLWEYLRDSISKEQLIAPTLTTYIPTKQKVSLLSNYEEGNIKARNVAKKEMFVAKAAGDEFLEQTKKGEQTNRKLANNAISGAHVSPSTPLYNKTAHSTLTSNCRSTSGYGNANNEKFLSGNRHYFSYKIVINNIVSIIRNTDYDKLQKLISDRNIYLPTTDDVMDCITYSTKLYWFEKIYLDKIRVLIDNLNPLEKAAFVYTGDLYHLKKHNEQLVKDFIVKLSAKVEGKCENALSIVKSAPEDHLNLAHQICRKETKGIGKDHSIIDGTPKIETLALTCLNIKNIINEYSDIISTLWVTKNIPASVAHFPDSIRRAALVSDTDSTIFTVQDWVIWHKKGVSFDDDANAVAATMIFLASSTITHVLALMSANFGIDSKHLFKIAMKNEFKFDVFVPTQLGKHYYANISCQEGNVFEDHDIEIKGVHLKSSNTPKILNKQSEQMMTDIMNDIMANNEISIVKYLKRVADIERGIEKSIREGDSIYFRKGSIKNSSSYTKDEEESPYMRHIFWNDVFGPKYGNMPEPPYDNVKIAVNINNTTDFKKWLNSIKDITFKDRLAKWLLANNKTIITTFYIPLEIIQNNGIPLELIDIIDYRRIIKDCCNSFYIILESIGVYVNGDKVDRLVSDNY